MSRLDRRPTEQTGRRTRITRMLNYIWFGLMAIALVIAAFNGTAEAVSKAAVDSAEDRCRDRDRPGRREDRKSTRLNSSHSQISYAVFCLKKKKTKNT